MGLKASLSYSAVSSQLGFTSRVLDMCLHADSALGSAFFPLCPEHCCAWSRGIGLMVSTLMTLAFAFFQWKQNAPTLAQWAIGQTLMINQLIDMEWRFGGN